MSAYSQHTHAHYQHIAYAVAEFTHAGGKLWYDISIIPTSATQGPEYCPSLAACKQLTGGTGYNEPMQIAPQSGINGAHCRVLTCLSDGCDDAYQFPKDDTKTHNCPGATDFVVTFCPNGSGGARAVPAPVPTTTAPAPVATTASPRPTTAAPTTQPPTPVPTTAAPTPVPVVVNSSVEIERDADQLVAGSAASQATGTPIDVIVNPELATQTQKPVFDTNASVSTPVPTQTSEMSNANTQSSNTAGGSTLTTVFVAAVLVLAAAVAIVAIVVVRRKKRELDAQTEKSPIMNPGLATL